MEGFESRKWIAILGAVTMTAGMVTGCGNIMAAQLVPSDLVSDIKYEIMSLAEGKALDKDAQENIAVSMSTQETAQAMDFDWFIDKVYSISNGEYDNITDSQYVVRIGGEEAFLLNGGWKCYMCGGDTEYTSNHERYLNAVIETDGEDFDIDFNWWIYFDSAAGSSVEEEGSAEMDGKWNDEKASAHAEGELGTVDLTDFYLSKEIDAEFAVGKIIWENGEVDHIGLMRMNPERQEQFDKALTAVSNTADDIELMVERAKKKSGAPEAEIEWTDDHTLIIHLFETETEPGGTEKKSTWDRYTIDVNTMKGWDFFDNLIDLSK